MQETRVNPIQLDNTGAQMLFKLGDTIADINAQNKKLEWEKAKYANELKQKQLEKEAELQKNAYQQVKELQISDEAINSSLETYRKILASNQDPFEKQAEATQFLLNLKDQDTKFQAPIKALRAYYDGLPPEDKKGFLIGKAEQYIKSLHTITDPKTGKTQFRPADQMDAPENVVNGILNGPDAHQFWAASTGREAVDNDLKNMEESELTVSVRDQKGLKRTGETTSVKFKPLIQQFDDKTGKIVLKTDENGYINDEAYAKYKDDPKINAWLNREASEIAEVYNRQPEDVKKKVLAQYKIKEESVPQLIDPESNEFWMIKKAVLTNYLQNYTNEVSKKAESTTIVSNNYFGNNQNGSGVKTDPVFTSPVDRVKAILEGNEKFIGTFDSKTGSYDVTNQFRSLPIYENLLGKKYGPASVKYFPRTETTEPYFEVQQNGKKKPEVISAQAWADKLIPVTAGNDYDKNKQPKVR